MTFLRNNGTCSPRYMWWRSRARSPMSLASRRTHMLSRRQVSLLSSGIAYCEPCCVLIAPGIQRSQSLPTQSTYPATVTPESSQCGMPLYRNSLRVHTTGHGKCRSWKPEDFRELVTVVPSFAMRIYVTGTRYREYSRGKRWEPDHESIGIPEPGYELGSGMPPMSRGESFINAS